jgi:hypothetical protein
MIVILKREDLSPDHQDCKASALQLHDTCLSPELAEQCEAVVFVEGMEIKFLKHFPGIKSQESLDILLDFILSTRPSEPRRWSLKRFGQRRNRD